MKNNKILDSIKERPIVNYIKNNRIANQVQRISPSTRWKILMGMIAFGMCASMYSSCRKGFQLYKEQEAQRKSVGATLIDKELHGRASVTLFLSLNQKLSETDALINVDVTRAKRRAFIHDVTNGTHKTIGEWEKLTHGYTSYCK